MSEHTSQDILRIMRDEVKNGVVTMHNVKRHFNLQAPQARKRFELQVAFLIATGRYFPIDQNKGIPG